jgi:sensor domain CHASE-containing protein
MEALAVLLFAVMAGVVIGVLLWIARRQDRQRTRQRGFEVEQNAGSQPVLKEKENDHG